MDYIKHQLELARAKNPIFDDKCYPTIHTITYGIPRRINQLCYNSMLQVWLDKKPIITVDDIKAVVEKSPHIFDKFALTDAGTNAAHI